MTNDHPIRLVAVVGGSGAGKTWLADRLQHAIGPEAGRLTLDDFYLDRSYLSPARRAAANFDHPQAIDWPFVEQVLRDCRAGRQTLLPRYDFGTHTRLRQREKWIPTPVIIMDGLWLLWRVNVRELFDHRVYLDCPASLRLERRLTRDVAQRDRTPESVREQFRNTVGPMHELYVAPQTRWADFTLNAPPGEDEIQNLIRVVQNLQPRDPRQRTTKSAPAWRRSPLLVSP